MEDAIELPLKTRNNLPYDPEIPLLGIYPEKTTMRYHLMLVRMAAIGMRWEGRWEGAFRMGNTCTLMADSCRCMAKTTTIL